VDASAVGVPKPAVGLIPGTYVYATKIEIGGQTIKMSVKREIKDENGAWVITDTTATPMGDARETVVLDHESLALVKRTASQGPVAVEMAVSGGKATGKITGVGEDKPIDVTLGGPVFADGAGGPPSLAALALAEGFETVYRNVEPWKGRRSSIA